VEGLSEMPYKLPNFQLEAHLVKSPVPTLWWRSVGNTHTAFVKETMIDEAAHAAGKDPLEYRKSLLGAHPRQLALLDKVRDMSGWGRNLPEGSGLGVAIHESFGTIVADVAEVQVADNGIRVQKVWCAVDCGFAVNPLGVAAQMESAVVFALTAALFGEITIEEGAAKQSNFHDYPMVRMDQAPQVEVAVINSGADMGGIGEPGTPPLFPVVGNAIFAATGKRLRSLPFRI
jgi:isoquinoline 1-oxidoreductase beta subunit